MTARKFAQGIAACLLVAAGAAKAGAQAQDAFCDASCVQDYQFFAPVDFDYDCQVIRRDCGYFFEYNRVSWFVQGEKSPLGAPGVVLSEDIWPIILQADIGQNPPERYIVQNGIQDPTPGEFGWGNRYQFGYFNGQHSLMFGVIDNQRMATFQSFGNGPEPSGFGSIHINFELASLDLLNGFRDYGGVIVGGTEIPTPTQGGPGTGGNGVPDDLDADLLAGTGFFFIDVDGDGVFSDGDIITAIFADYGDGYEFNVTFNQVTVRNQTRTDGVEIMKNYVLDNSHWFVTEQNAQLEIGAGVRFLRVEDRFAFVGNSDLLRGRNRLIPGNVVNTDVENQIVGPQLFARYTRQHNRLKLGVDGRFVFGYNIQDLDQNGVIGINMTPGDVNQPFILQPTAFRYGRQENDFAPVVEFRADARYQLTQSLAFKLGYTAIFVDNVSRASSVTRWRLPDMGFRPAGQQEIFMNGADFGFEVNF